MKNTLRSTSRALCFALCGLMVPTTGRSAEPLNLPIAFDLEKASTVTVVIEDAAGKRVRNLIAAARLAPGRNLLSWDGYDEGETQPDGSTMRKLVPPGRYLARGLTSDGLRLIYEFPVNSPGSPPWFTKDRSGAWLADHTAAHSVVFAPASVGALGGGQDRVIFGGIAAEAGDAFMALDMNGKKIVGNNDFGWTGAYAMAVDQGPQALSEEGDPWLYCLAPEKNTVTLNVFHRNGSTSRLLRHTTKESHVWNGGRTGDSIAAWNGWVVISVPQDNELLLIDVRAKSVAGRIPMKDPRGVLFDDKGQLLVATANQVERFTLDTKAAKLSDGITVVSGLEDAQQLARDASGNLYVADWGLQHVVKMLSPAGVLIRTLGKPGGPQLGKFDDQRMHYPKGMAVDTRGQLWVADADHLPKRISAWSTKDGALVKSIVGGPKYGGGGTLDPADRTRLYYGIYDGGYTMKLDWKAGTSVIDSVYTRPEHRAKGDRDKVPSAIPEDAIHIGKRTYLVPNFMPSLNGNPVGGTIWLLGKDGVAWPVAIVGGTHLEESTHGGWNASRNPGVAELFKDLQQKTGMKHLLIWSDRNLDGRAQPDEFVSWPTDVPYSEQIRFNNDLSFTMRGVAMPAPSFLPNGVPVWAPDAKPTLVTDTPGDGNTVSTNDGWALRMARNDKTDSIIGYQKAQLRWSYPFQDYNQITSDPGMMIHGQRFLGPAFSPQEGQAGSIFGINGEKGSLYLMTTDGLFIQDIGGDVRVMPHIGVKYPKAQRGMVVEGISFYDEHYGPSLAQTKEGEVILNAGKEFSAIFRVDGLQSVKRREFAAIDLDAKRLAGLPPTITRAARKQGRLTLPVAVGNTAPKVDGKLQDWPQDTAWAKLDERASGTVRVVGDRLYAAWRTGDPDALANAAGEPKLLFKRGGAVDLMIGTDPKADPKRQEPVAGDLRLLATMQAGKPKIMLYRAVVPGTPPDAAVPFISPVGSVSFDRVDDVSAQAELVQQGGDIELSIPLAVLGMTVPAGEMIIQGDIGLLRGTGAMTTQRLYWNNLNTAINSDIPSEARLQPGNWGTWRLVPERMLQTIEAVTPPSAVVPGLSWSYLETRANTAADITNASSAATGHGEGLDLKGIAKRSDDYVIVFEGYVEIPADGGWSFSSKVDDGCRVLVSGLPIINSIGESMRDSESVPIQLTKGLHPIRVEFVQWGGDASLELSWTGPGQQRQPIPATAYRRKP